MGCGYVPAGRAEGCLSCPSSFLIPTLAARDLSAGWGSGCAGEEDAGNHPPCGVLLAAEGGFRGGDVEGSGVATFTGRSTPILSRIMVEMGRGGAVPATGLPGVCTCAEPRVPVSKCFCGK